MTHEAQQDHRGGQISRAFALLTAKLEDASTLAVEGQGPQGDDQLLDFARQIAELAGEAATISGALAALLTRGLGERTRD